MTSDLYGSQERIKALGVTSCDATPTLDVPKGVFYQVPVPIEVPVVLARFFAAATRWNLYLHTLASRSLNDGVAVIPSVDNQVLGINAFDQRFYIIRSGMWRYTTTNRLDRSCNPNPHRSHERLVRSKAGTIQQKTQRINKQEISS